MIEPIVIKVVDKVPIVVSGPQYVVCDNSDYTVVWQLDEEWAQFESRTMQVNYKDGTYERVLFTGNTCALPAIPVKDWFYVGLFAGDIHTTRPVKLFANRAITTDSGEERDPMPDGYAQAIKALDGKLDKNQGAENAGKALVVGDDGTVVPGEAQGGSLPAMSSDTAGKLLTNDGDKAEWGEVPKEVMVVNFAQDNGGKWSADKSWDDAAALIEAGGYVYAMVDTLAIPFVNYAAGNVIVFHIALHNTSVVKYNVVIWHQDGLISVLEAGIPIVMYGEQTLTADQQAQARKNIGLTPVAKTDEMTQSVGLDAETGELYTKQGAKAYTLPIASPTQLGGVKPVAKTDAMTKNVGVDDNGGLYTEPAEVYYIDLAGDYPNYTCPVAMADIKAAYEAGKVLKCRCNKDFTTETLSLVTVIPYAGIWAFSTGGALSELGMKPTMFSVAIAEDRVLVEETEVVKQDDSLRFPNPNALTITSGSTTVTYDGSTPENIDIPDIPTALPNPNAFTIKVGDTTTTYDGSAAKTVKVPDGNNPLDITGAQVGQIAKITAVDTDGKPTKWEPVDMAGGEEVWENLTFSIPENDPVSAATINLPSTNIVKACIQISLFGTLENTKFGVMVLTGNTTGVQFLSAEIYEFYTTAQQIRTAAIVLEKKADSWQSIFNTNAIAGARNNTGALRLTPYNSDFLYIKTPTANETFYGTIEVNYVIGGSI
nr:MAG TPA: hypothetical protein [Caudoviricetes sp.]